MTTLQIIGLIFIITSIWIAFEFWRAPLMDEQGNIIEREKKLSDLLKRRKK